MVDHITGRFYPADEQTLTGLLVVPAHVPRFII